MHFSLNIHIDFYVVFELLFVILNIYFFFDWLYNFFRTTCFDLHRLSSANKDCKNYGCRPNENVKTNLPCYTVLAWRTLPPGLRAPAHIAFTKHYFHSSVEEPLLVLQPPGEGIPGCLSLVVGFLSIQEEGMTSYFQFCNILNSHFPLTPPGDWLEGSPLSPCLAV